MYGVVMSKKIFDDSDYMENVFLKGKTIKKDNEDLITILNVARDIRKFEIELFWKRGAYFWAFILGIYTAYFGIIMYAINPQNIYLKNLIELPLLHKIILFILSFLGFVFCLSWVLVNKGSKFWQENWENHISILEKTKSIILQDTFLNTSNRQKFNSNPFLLNAYDYSVTKITIFGSIVLMVISFIILVFHLFLIILKIQVIEYFDLIKIDNILSIFLFIICLLGIVFVIYKLLSCKGNFDKNNNIIKEFKWQQKI